MPFIPITREEALRRGWNELDVIFVTGDAYIDHPSFGVPLLARWLEAHGFRVGIISQPDWRSKEPFMALGRPRLFFAVSAGAMDSMVAHYTPLKKLRRDDAYTPGGRHGARPNRATIVYTARLKEAYKDVPVVIGGIEASLRRFAHYDYWEDTVRRSILFDSKADMLTFGMGESPILRLAQRMSHGERFADIRDIRGTALRLREGEVAGLTSVQEIPSFEAVAASKKEYASAFRMISEGDTPYRAVPLVQRHGDRYLFCNPSSPPMSEQEMDAVYLLPFLKAPHPSYKEPIPAWEQIRASITTHRGCAGGCAFCAITHHQGRILQSRSEQSILDEVQRLKDYRWFKGSISDVGGPTANMYGAGCEIKGKDCKRQSCLWPKLCRHLRADGRRGAELLRKIRKVPGVKHVTVSSGIRHDLLERQPDYFRELLAHHVGGLLKVAPEHSVGHVLDVMHKPGQSLFSTFLAAFREESRHLGKRQAIVPYLMSGHPGSTLSDMVDLALFIKGHGLKVEQVQEFTPTPGTLATCIYYTGIDPLTGAQPYVARGEKEKRLQKSLLLSHIAEEHGRIREALRQAGRERDAKQLLGDGERKRSQRSGG
jgi:uncharacterized radical SAM protein YgiQ